MTSVYTVLPAPGREVLIFQFSTERGAVDRRREHTNGYLLARFRWSGSADRAGFSADKLPTGSAAVIW